MPVWALCLIMVAGLGVSGYFGWLGAEWLGSQADEAPIAFVPLFCVSVGTFALAVVVPLIVSRHYVPAGPKGEANSQRERCDELSAHGGLPELVKWERTATHQQIACL